MKKKEIKDIQLELNSHDKIITLSFKNIHPDFKKIKVNLFDINNKNEGIQVDSYDNELIRFRMDYKDKMHLLNRITIQTGGLPCISNRNLMTTMLCKSIDIKGVSRNVPCNLAPKMSAYQQQSDIIDFKVSDLFNEGCEHEMEFEIYPGTIIYFTLHFTNK